MPMTTLFGKTLKEDINILKNIFSKKAGGQNITITGLIQSTYSVLHRRLILLYIFPKPINLH